MCETPHDELNQKLLCLNVVVPHVNKLHESTDYTDIETGVHYINKQIKM